MSECLINPVDYNLVVQSMAFGDKVSKLADTKKCDLQFLGGHFFPSKQSVL